MSKRTAAQVACLAIGMILFVYGIAYDDQKIRLWGIGFLVPAFLLRFLAPRP
jgi:FtsH-binding integral membrane protein